MEFKDIKNIKTGIQQTSANSKVIFASIIAETVPTMNKKGNPFYDETKKEFIVMKRTEAVIMLGNEYASAVQNRINKTVEESQIENLFTAEKPSGRHFVEGYENLILESDKDANTHYLRTYYNLANNHPKTTYLIDGKEADPDQLVELDKWVKKSAPSQKQENAGLEEQKQVVVRDYKLENVKKIKFGDITVE